MRSLGVLSNELCPPAVGNATNRPSRWFRPLARPQGSCLRCRDDDFSPECRQDAGPKRWRPRVRRMWWALATRSAIQHRGSVIPSHELRANMCGPPYDDDEFFLDSSVAQARRLMKAVKLTDRTTIVDVDAAWPPGHRSRPGKPEVRYVGLDSQNSSSGGARGTSNERTRASGSCTSTSKRTVQPRWHEDCRGLPAARGRRRCRRRGPLGRAHQHGARAHAHLRLGDRPHPAPGRLRPPHRLCGEGRTGVLDQPERLRALCLRGPAPRRAL